MAADDDRDIFRVWLHALRDLTVSNTRPGWGGVAFLLGAWAVIGITAALGAALAGAGRNARTLVAMHLALVTWWLVVMESGPDRLIVALLVAPVVGRGLPLIAGHTWAFVPRRFNSWRNARACAQRQRV